MLQGNGTLGVTAMTDEPVEDIVGGEVTPDVVASFIEGVAGLNMAGSEEETGEALATLDTVKGQVEGMDAVSFIDGIISTIESTTAMGAEGDMMDEEVMPDEAVINAYGGDRGNMTPTA